MSNKDLRDWFQNHVRQGDSPYLLSDEQACVVLDTHKNTLVTARAGSGKTHTLIAKIVYLIAYQEVDPAKIMALGFNHEPQEDFKRRLRNIRVDGKPLPGADSIARTFHSLAYNLSKKFEENPGNTLTDSDQKQYIRAILDHIIDPQHLYDFVRDDSYEPRREDYTTDQDYYATIRNQRYETLDGSKVKSRGEKIIADYLFEHGIKFKYEGTEFYPHKLTKYAHNDSVMKLNQYDKIKPDFCLEIDDRKILWEHWGIRGDESKSEIDEINRSGVIGNYYEYQTKKDFKEWFYSRDWLDSEKIQTPAARQDTYLQHFLKYDGCIYTNYQAGISREDFESILDQKLDQAHIHHEKLPSAELLEKFSHNIVATQEMNTRVSNFIQRAEQQYPGDFAGLQRDCQKETNSQVRQFYRISLATYAYYLQELTASPLDGKREIIDELFPDAIYNDDHSLYLDRAARNIAAGASSAEIVPEQIEYLFLDEYQDFSLLFLNLVNALRKRSPKLKILAVGDDWQAINSYAGASLEFFQNFEKYFSEDAAHLRISTNRRSCKTIVEVSNQFMHTAIGDDNSALSIEDDLSEPMLNSCVIERIRKFWDVNGRIAQDDIQSRYMLLLAQIVHDNPGKSILVLNRTNEIKLGNQKIGLQKFEENWRTKISHNHTNKSKLKKVEEFKTVNRAKGLEADVVILLESDMGRFPIFHPDSYLYRVFGETPQRALDEQKRLFYVAITRARQKLYIIHKFNIYNVDTSSNSTQNQTEERTLRDGDFLRMLDIDQFEDYSRPKLLSIDHRVRYEGEEVTFLARDIQFYRNREDPTTVDIAVYTQDRDRVVQYKAFPNGESVSDLKQLRANLAKTAQRVLAKPHNWRGITNYVHLFAANNQA